MIISCIICWSIFVWKITHKYKILSKQLTQNYLITENVLPPYTHIGTTTRTSSCSDTLQVCTKITFLIIHVFIIDCSQ